jgi:hypothetical protein
MRLRTVRLLVLVVLAALLLPGLAACTQAPPASLTPFPTENDATAAQAFLDAARQRSTDGLTCGGTVYSPSLGISEADFLSLSVYASTANGPYKEGARFRGQPYYCRVFFQAYGYLRGTVTITGYTISFDDPHPGVTATGGGIATVTKVYENGKVVGEDDYYDQTLNFFGHSVGVIYREAGDVKVLDIYYKPDCEGSQPHLTLVLVPVSAP